MDKMWIEFEADWVQKAVPDKDIEEKKFEKGSQIQLTKSVAEALIAAGLAKEIEEPVDTTAFGKVMNEAAEQIESSIERVVAKSFEKFAAKLEEEVIPAVVSKGNVDDEFRGFKDEGHFMACVLEKTRSGKSGVAPDAAKVGGQQYFDLLEKAPSGQNISNDSEGGFMVPDVTSNAIWSNMEENPLSFLPRTDRFSTAGNSLKVPRMFEPSRKKGTGLRHAGISVVWLDEADELTATQGNVGTFTHDLHKLGAVIYFTEEQLDDAPSAWNNRITAIVPDAIMFETNFAILYGSGVGKPKGCLSKVDSLIVVPATKRNGDAQDNHTILHWNLSQMYWANINRDRAVWIIHPDTAQQLEFLVFDDDTTNKRQVYSPLNRGLLTPGSELFAGPYGLPMFIHEMAKDFGSEAGISLVDFGEYQTLTKVGGGVKTASSIHVRFLFEETAFRYTFRIGGDTQWTSAKEDLHGTTVRSPFVTLASRTGGGTSSGL